MLSSALCSILCSDCFSISAQLSSSDYSIRVQPHHSAKLSHYFASSRDILQGSSTPCIAASLNTTKIMLACFSRLAWSLNVGYNVTAWIGLHGSTFALCMYACGIVMLVQGCIIYLDSCLNLPLHRFFEEVCLFSNTTTRISPT